MLRFISVLSIMNTSFYPENGDLLFQDVDCGPMCEAIEQVTTGYNGAKFSHIGLVVKENNNTFILEAISDGVVLTPLHDFLNRSLDKEGNPKIVAGRILPEYKHLIQTAVDEAKNTWASRMIINFVLENGSYYCSELIYLAF
ncbi:MAG: hypothetical protein HC906_09960 [Bacteroidales bacterium]|nr:hypothetical protein [Bacteroidales bacterium]